MSCGCDYPDPCINVRVREANHNPNLGPQGPQGVIGPQGLIGVTGGTGIAGPQGFQGAFGGPQGYQGNRGYQGYQGNRGYQGYQGMSVGGSSTQVQYNQSGNFAGSPLFIFDQINTRLGVNQASPKTTLDVRGGVSFNRTPVDNVDYSVLVTDCFIGVRTDSASVTLDLPPASSGSPGQLVIVTDEGGSAGTNAITIHPAGGDHISGNPGDIAVSNNFGSVTMYSDGTTHWYIIASN